MGDVARAEPAVLKFIIRGIFVIGARDPGSAHLDFPHRLAIPRQNLALIIDNAHLHTCGEPPGSRTPIHLITGVGASWRMGHRGQGTGLGHSPGLDHSNPVLLVESLHQTTRHGGPATDHHAEAR